MADIYRPDFSFNPGLQGLYALRDRGRYDRMMSLEEQMKQAQTGKEVEDFQEGRAARQAQRAAIVRDLPVKSRELEATTLSKELTAAEQEALHEGKIELGLGEQDLNRGQQNIARVIQAIANAPDGPDYISRIGTAMKQAGVNPKTSPILGHILGAPTPREASARAHAYLQQQSFTNPAYRQAMDVTDLKGRYDLEGRHISGQYSVDAARANAKSPVDPMDQLLKTNDPVQKYMLAGHLARDPHADPKVRALAQELERVYGPMVKAITEARQQNQFQGSPIAPRPVPIPPPAAPGPQVPTAPGALPAGTRPIPR